MIDLQPAIRQFILSDTTFTAFLSTYLDTKAVFTRRPVPQDAQYPLAIISPLIADLQNDFVSCGGRRVITHDISIYSTNDDSLSYRNVEAAAYRLSKIMHRIPAYSLVMPAGSSLIQTNAIGPLPAATDDLVKIARVVSINFEIFLENY